jgi:hypothetical protein
MELHMRQGTDLRQGPLRPFTISDKGSLIVK